MPSTSPLPPLSCPGAACLGKLLQSVTNIPAAPLSNVIQALQKKGCQGGTPIATTFLPRRSILLEMRECQVLSTSEQQILVAACKHMCKIEEGSQHLSATSHRRCKLRGVHGVLLT